LEFECVVRNGRVVTASDAFDADIGIVDGTIAAIQKNLPSAVTEIDATGKLVAPGCIDVNTKFDLYVDQFGERMADDYESGTRAAAAGGVTTVLAYAFQQKGESLESAVDAELDRGKGNAHVDFGLHLGITDIGARGTLEALGALVEGGFSSAKIFTAIELELTNRETLQVLQAARDQGVLVCVHAEDGPLISHLTRWYLGKGLSDVGQYPRVHLTTTEALATSWVATYARVLGTPVYFVHLSCKAALDAVRVNRAQGGEIYVETRPVYLLLDETLYGLPNLEGNKYLCTPPLRSADNQTALWDGLRNDEIQTWASDHSPWQQKQKMDANRTFDKIPSGMSLVQTSPGLLFAEGVKKGRISPCQFVRLTSTNPAKLFGMFPKKGSISPGADADLVLIDPELRVHITREDMASKADYDPFEGWEGIGWPVLTMSRGEVIAQDGVTISKPGRGRFLHRTRYSRL
jgi:dihydropyrimidinase